MTGAMLAIWPTFTSLGHLTAIVIALLVFQKALIRGLTSGAVKG